MGWGFSSFTFQDLVVVHYKVVPTEAGTARMSGWVGVFVTHLSRFGGSTLQSSASWYNRMNGFLPNQSDDRFFVMELFCY